MFLCFSFPQGVLQWNEETTPTNVTPTLHINSNPFQLLVTHGNQGPLVVYTDGCVGRCGPQCGGADPCLVPKGGGARWVVVRAETYGGGGGCVCVVSVDSKERRVGVGVVRVVTGQQDGGMVLKQPCVSVVRKKTTLLSCCVCGDQLWMLCECGCAHTTPYHILYHNTPLPPNLSTLCGARWRRGITVSLSGPAPSPPPSHPHTSPSRTLLPHSLSLG